MTQSSSLPGLKSAIGLFLTFFCLFALVLPAHAENVPLRGGKYECFTITVTAQSQTAADILAANNRAEAGNTIRPLVAPQMLLAPAAFGNIILDGHGGYTMPRTHQSGRYGFNRATGLPTFTGDLGAMKLVEYKGTGDSFSVGWQGMNFHCGLPAPPSKAISAGSQAPNQEFVSYSGPVLRSASAADFRGHYEGSYVCSTVANFMQLDLQADSDGTMTGVMQFGGMKTPEASYSIGSYALRGTWRGSHYVLKGERWIKQPQGYVMIDLEGDLTTLGTSGRVLYSSCDSYATRRVSP